MRPPHNHMVPLWLKAKASSTLSGALGSALPWDEFVKMTPTSLMVLVTLPTATISAVSTCLSGEQSPLSKLHS